MVVDSYFIPFHLNEVHVTRYGRGADLLIVFHGFSESGELYRNLGVLLEEKYTVLIPDMPYHGRTRWKEGLLSPGRLKELVKLILEKEEKDRCSVLGYSMGGRAAICLARYNPEVIDHLLLLAPEGLRKNHWFRFATGTLVGRALFKWVTFRPAFLLFLLNTGRFLGLVSEKMALFIKDQMDMPEKRLRVYQLWMCFRKLRINRRRFYAVLKANRLPVWICLGKYDRLIPSRIADKIKPLSLISVIIVESGHQLLLDNQVLENIYTFLCPPQRT